MVWHLLRRMCHWGPILAVLIIKCITLTTLHVTSMWLPPSSGLVGLTNYLFFFLLVGLTMYHFFSAMFIGPGYVSFGWKPEKIEDSDYLQYCSTCEGYKAPRAHHCRKCDRCVLKMDHHCPWINNCVGHFNHSHFTLFLLCAVIGSIQATALLVIAIYRTFHLAWYLYHDQKHFIYLSIYGLIFTVFSLGLAVGVIVAVGGLFLLQMKSILKNQTSIESWIVTKAESRARPEGERFDYPYSLGMWNNFLQVFFTSPGDGITWPVVNGCHQYTLTTEQLIQKQDKRARSRQYTIIRPYGGSWFPVTFGLHVCCSFPWTDDPRISISTGDKVIVTRWRRHWLYGEKIPGCRSPNIVPARLRGWFPRKCAVEFTSADCEMGKTNKKLQ